MIEAILYNKDLTTLLANEIEENGVGVKLDADFYDDNGQLDSAIILNMKVDSYYNSLRLAATPPSIDNLVVIKRSKNRFSVYLIELKNVNKLRRLDYTNIKNKFETTLNDFMKNRFKNEFEISTTKITDFNVWLVCNRFDFMGKEISHDDYERRIKSTIIEQLMLTRPFCYKGKYSQIIPMLCEGNVIS